MLRTLCDVWHYTPEQAIRAPVWVLQMTALLALEEEVKPKPETGVGG